MAAVSYVRDALSSPDSIDEFVEDAEDDELREMRRFLEEQRYELEPGSQENGSMGSGERSGYTALIRHHPRQALKAGVGLIGARGVALSGLGVALASSSPTAYVGGSLVAGVGFAGVREGYRGISHLRNVKSVVDTVPDDVESYDAAIETINAALED